MAGGERSAFGKYYLIKRIASGGMGEVFLAKLKGPVGGFEKLLVIKRILAHHIENQEFVDMFFAEARIAAQLSHSNIVQIHEMGEIDDAYYIAMEYVQGKALRDMIDRARKRGEYLHPAHVIDVIGKLCEGLSYAHAARSVAGERLAIIHRDVNPHNVLVSYSGEVKVIDFGIAKSHMQGHKTETGTIKGKFVYMSPEQSAARAIDKRSDLFSVGICLYEALTLRNPFVRANVVMSLDAIHRDNPPPVSETHPRLAPFDPIIKKALAKVPDERYPDCMQVRDELQALLTSAAVPAAPQSLSAFMFEAFADQIEYEKQLILDSDQVDTAELMAMHEAGEREHQTGANRRASSGRVTSSDRLRAGSSDRVRTPSSERLHTSSSDRLHAAPHEHSRLPFVMILTALVLMSGAAAGAVFKLVERRRLGLENGALATWLVPQPNPPTLRPEPKPEPRPVQVHEATPPPSALVREANPPPHEVTHEVEPRNDPAENEDEGHKKGKRGKEHSKLSPQSVPKPAPVATPAAKPASPPPPPGEPVLGNLTVSTVPPLAVLLNGSAVGQTIKVKGASGRLQIGTGKDAQSDPFVLKVRYQVNGDQMTYDIDAEPWAIVRQNGIGIGKTPVKSQPATGSVVLELVNPKDKLQLRATLRFVP